MRTPGLNSQTQRLQWLIGQAASFGATQVELQAHWGRYLCVLTSGFLENAIGGVYSEYARRSANPNVARFAQSIVLKIQNPNSAKFVDVARSFSKIWGDELEAFMEQDGRKEAIDAIIANRHLIAHGNDSGITVARVSDYLHKSITVIEFIEAQCGCK